MAQLSFDYNGKHFENFDLDDPETIDFLKTAHGLTEQDIENIKNNIAVPPTLEERLQALEDALLDALDL